MSSCCWSAGRDAPLRVALVTTHLALKDVPAAVTREALDATLAIVAAELHAKFALASPRIAVCGLNPHAGEGGHLGREEIDIIAPAIAAMRAAGHDVTGPFPADTVFVPEIARRFDAIVAMYHDQGLPVLKAASFGHGINVTLGLPFIRTSVDHGTALDLAPDAAKARGADPGSLIAAVDLAIALAGRADVAPRDASSAPDAAQFAARPSMEGHQPRQRFGQNFLADPHYIARIVDAVAPQPGDRLVEIGPGLAALTRPLIERAGHLVAVEIDRDLAARLASEFAPSQLTLHVADALEFDFAALGPALRVVGNLPYNISSPLLFRLAQFDAQLVDVHVMLQKEVVARMTARPATPEYGRLTVMLQALFRVDAALRRPRGSLPAGAQGRFGGRAPRSARRARNRTSPTSRCSAASSARPSASGARRCATRSSAICDEAALRLVDIDPGARGETLSVAAFRAACELRWPDDRRSGPSGAFFSRRCTRR